MSRFLTTIPSNTGFVNLGLVETYPTGGGGPTAYGPTSYFDLTLDQQKMEII